MEARGRRARIGLVAVALTVLFGGLLARAVDLTVVRGPDFARRADRQHRQEVTLVPHRGEIIDRNGELLAVSVNVPSVYARPRQLGDDRSRVPELAKSLQMPVTRVQAQLARKQPFVWLKRQAMPSEAEGVASLGLPGVGHFAEARRFYPQRTLAAHILGFVGTDATGLGGLEMRFDKQIRGDAQTIEVDRDARGREFLRASHGTKPTQGSRVELTIDATIQAATERELALGVANAKAIAGAAVVLDPHTGEILALANVPTFNPNDPADWGDKKHKDRIRNRAITDPYEPGSTFKAILAASALEEGVTNPNERIFCENGAHPIGKWVIHDSHPHGWLSFAEVIQFSSNIGVSKVADRLGKERYHAYLRKFGFGQRSGVELPDESPGIMRGLDKWVRINLATQSFGQGISVTPIQMVAAYAAIANGGTLMKPHVVRKITSPTGEVTYEQRATPVRRVISEETARTTTELLRRVVEEKGGTGSKARLDDFSVAGKTGTAQKVDSRTRAYSSKRIGSFVGFLPADNPRAVILVLIDEPSTSSYGGVVAAPVFGAIAREVLAALRVQAPAKPTVEMPPAVHTEMAAVPAIPDDVGPVRPGTPSFLGLSMREALTRAHATGWDVHLTGSGWVTEQVPAAGTPLADDRRLALELRTDRGPAQP
ncbi:MAG TPA: penicillin-binding protein [Candidatus Binatia bacterium]|jgi:cell division protein FtsI (penicillin-binding protein 3)|nr:penicillin-binding protein [Candidatus Binatia bacterium]